MDYTNDSFEEQDDSSTDYTVEQRRASLPTSPQPNLILEDDDDDYVQEYDDDDDESWDEPNTDNNLRPQMPISRPQSAVINGGRPESAPGRSRPPSASAIPISTERIVIEPIHRLSQTMSDIHSKNKKKSPTTPVQQSRLLSSEERTGFVSKFARCNWELPAPSKTPRIRFRGEYTTEWPPRCQGGRRLVPGRPASASAEDHAEVARVRAALDISISKLRNHIKIARNEVVCAWRTCHAELEHRVSRSLEILRRNQEISAKQARIALHEKFNPAIRISPKVLDLMSTTAAHAVASGRSSRLCLSLERQKSYQGGLLVSRKAYDNAMYHDEKRIETEKKVHIQSSSLNIQQIHDRKVSREIAFQILTKKQKKEMDVLITRAQYEQRRLMYERNQSLSKLDHHALNAEEVVVHAELLERNLRTNPTSLGSAGVAAEMARSRAERVVKDLHKHYSQAVQTALHFKIEFVMLTENEETNEKQEVNEKHQKGEDDVEDPSSEVCRDEEVKQEGHEEESKKADSVIGKKTTEKVNKNKVPAKAKTTTKVRRSKKGVRKGSHRKRSTVAPEQYSCSWCCVGVRDMKTLITLPAVGGPSSIAAVSAQGKTFCSWNCAKSWNLKHSPVLYRHARDVLIDLEAGDIIAESPHPEGKFQGRDR